MGLQIRATAVSAMYVPHSPRCWMPASCPQDVALRSHQYQYHRDRPSTDEIPHAAKASTILGSFHFIPCMHDVVQIWVKQRDHHCPLTGGCIGANNFRFFFLFLMHNTAGLAYCTCLSWFPFRACTISRCAVCSPPPHTCPPRRARSHLSECVHYAMNIYTFTSPPISPCSFAHRCFLPLIVLMREK